MGILYHTVRSDMRISPDSTVGGTLDQAQTHRYWRTKTSSSSLLTRGRARESGTENGARLMGGMTDEEIQLLGLPLTSQVILESDPSITHVLFHPVEMKPMSSQRTVRTREVCTCAHTHIHMS